MREFGERLRIDAEHLDRGRRPRRVGQVVLEEADDRAVAVQVRRRAGRRERAEDVVRADVGVVLRLDVRAGGSGQRGRIEQDAARKRDSDDHTHRQDRRARHPLEREITRIGQPVAVVGEVPQQRTGAARHQRDDPGQRQQREREHHRVDLDGRLHDSHGAVATDEDVGDNRRAEQGDLPRHRCEPSRPHGGIHRAPARSVAITPTRSRPTTAAAAARPKAASGAPGSSSRTARARAPDRSRRASRPPYRRSSPAQFPERP